MELIPHPKLNTIWLKSAVIGSLWASVEIVAGSFLHNLQIPFSGTILTAFAILLLSAFSRLWKEGGIFWRAGIICALMKSISPSAIIIGPMVGIITEALLFEWMLMLFGRNIMGSIAGGALASVSAIVHKVFTLLILYGFDFVRILDSLYQYAIRQLNMPDLQPAHLVGFLAAIYLIIGSLAALTGFLAGNRFLKSKGNDHSLYPVQFRNDNRLFGMSDKESYSTALILFHLVIMTTVLWLLNQNQVISLGLLALFYIGFCIYRYPTALRRLRKPAVWFQFILIVGTSILIWDVLKMRDSGGESGWLIGAKMIFRAILIIIGFAAISVELKNPIVKSVLYKRGLSNLYQSLTLAFGVLPDLVNSLTGSRLNLFNPANLLSHLLLTSRNLMEIFREEQNNLPAIFILTADVGGGKTTFAGKLIGLLRSKGYRPMGFLCTAIDQSSVRTGFTLVDVDTNRSILLAQNTYQEGWSQTGRYYFNPEAFKFGNGLLDASNLQGAHLVVIDEIGPMEVNGKGWALAIEKLSSALSTPQLWIVRKSLAHKITRRWNVGDIYLFDIYLDTEEYVIEKMEALLRAKYEVEAFPSSNQVTIKPI
jgi:nucleoside-triphosphatase THEP1